MNKLVIGLIIGCFLALVAESFLLGHKYKDGCDPNPCDHGKCTLDSKDKHKYDCACKDGYWGKNCTYKIGCHSKPCKHDAACVIHPLNKTQYTCKCTNGYVGINCEKKDYCTQKNPCKNGKCVIDKKGDQSCDCNPGFGSKNCDKHVCDIEELKLKQHTKKSSKLWIDKSIETKVKAVDDLAKLCKVHLHILKSFILHPDKSKGHTYDPRDKTNPNFYVGQAIGLHIYDPKDNLLCNDVCMAKVPCPVPEAKCFLDGLYAINWKTSILDPGVIHLNMHHANVSGYNRHREHMQKGCADKKFA